MAVEIPDHLRCHGINRDGSRCKRIAKVGDSFCEKHQSQAQSQVDVPAVPATDSAERREVLVAEVVRAAGIPGGILEPVEVLRWCVTQTYRISEQLTAALGCADPSEKAVFPLVRETLNAIEQTRRAAEVSESAGMARRRVVLEEAKAQQAFLILDRAIKRAALSVPDEARLRAAVGAEFQAAARANDEAA